MRLALLTMLLCAGAAGAAPARVDQLGWIAGCWAVEGAEAGTVEIWTAPAAGSALGMSRTVRAGRTATHEFMQLRDTTDGVVFIAAPAGQAPASFTAVTVEPGRAVFENAQHDFPQRIVYEVKDNGAALHARIEGRLRGQERTASFPMRRAACPAS